MTSRIEPDRAIDELAYRVIGAAIEVHRHLGPGYLESVYQEALKVELQIQQISFSSQYPFAVLYKNQPVGDSRLDFLVSGMLVVELKAIDCIAPIHRAQVISYLKSLKLHLGLLINFNVPVLKDGIERIVFTPS